MNDTSPWKALFEDLNKYSSSIFMKFNLESGGGYRFIPPSSSLGEKGYVTETENLAYSDIVSIEIPECFSKGKVQFKNDINTIKSLLEKMNLFQIITNSDKQTAGISGTTLSVSLRD